MWNINNEIITTVDICRLCGKIDGYNVLIFCKGSDHALRIQRLLPITVEESDELPKVICHRCTCMLLEFDTFIEQVLKTQAILKKGICVPPVNTSIDVPNSLNMHVEEPKIVPMEPKPTAPDELHSKQSLLDDDTTGTALKKSLQGESTTPPASETMEAAPEVIYIDDAHDDDENSSGSDDGEKEDGAIVISDSPVSSPESYSGHIEEGTHPIFDEVPSSGCHGEKNQNPVVMENDQLTGSHDPEQSAQQQFYQPQPKSINENKGLKMKISKKHLSVKETLYKLKHKERKNKNRELQRTNTVHSTSPTKEGLNGFAESNCAMELTTDKRNDRISAVVTPEATNSEPPDPANSNSLPCHINVIRMQSSCISNLYSCSLCKAIFLNVDAASRHGDCQNNTEPDESNKTHLNAPLNDTTTVHVCDLCDMSFSRQASFVSHRCSGMLYDDDSNDDGPRRAVKRKLRKHESTFTKPWRSDAI